MKFEHRNNWIRGRMFHQTVAGIARADVREVGFAVCKAMVAWNGGAGPVPDMALFRTAFSQGSKVLDYVAATALGMVVRGRPEALDTVLEVFRSVCARARCAILWNCPAKLSRSEHVEFVTEALRDRSRLVRLEAVWEVAWARLAELIPLLETMAASEADDETRRLLERCGAMARDGYVVEDQDESVVHLCVHHDGLMWMNVPTKYLARLSLAEIAEVIREHGPFPWPAMDERFDAKAEPVGR